MNAKRMWRWPIALGVLTAIGLLSALVADGVWDGVSWFGLALPVAVCAWYGAHRRPPR